MDLDLKELKGKLDLFFGEVQKAGPTGMSKVDRGLIPQIPLPPTQ